ncbi:MAG: MBL fold metallo-hydrolase [Bacteroidetes bacterium]|nr:MBL fold metallo-hydrolase [Bacteroidota bacterium]
MVLKVIASGSSGNCYLLQSNAETLIIEAGVRLQELKAALDYELAKVVGCLITHSHCDHSKYAKDYMKAGIIVYASKETILSCNLSGYRQRYLSTEPGTGHIAGNFIFSSFPVPHSVPTVGFLIYHTSAGTIFFVTDAAYIPNKFKNLCHILIEANYDETILKTDRAVGNHMSLSTCMHFLKSNDITQVQNIVLLHLSKENSNANMFSKSVKSIAPKANVFIADKNLEINLSKHPF